jgi:branched-chain amino acid transport system permease protein
VKGRVFVLSAVLGSLAGSLYAHFLTVLTPHTFGLELSIQLVVMVVLGGAASVLGPVVGACIVVLLTPILRQLSRELTGASGGQVEIVIFGLILMLMMVFMPRGLVPVLSDVFRHRAGRPADVGPAAAVAAGREAE